MIHPDQVALLIERGNAARELLSGSAFADVMNDLDTFHLSALVACPTGEAAKATRDFHHLRLHALREIIAEVTSRAQALDAYEAKQSGSADPYEDD